MSGDPPRDEATSTSYNCYRGMSLHDQILKVVEDSEIELTPLEIAQKLNANHSSVRVYLPILVKEGRIMTPYHGAYCSKITHGMMFVPVKVHNIVATGYADFAFSQQVVEMTGTVKVRVMFGLERKKVSIFVSCDAGMDKNACLFALHRGFDIVKEKLGKDLEQIELKTFEMNRDYLGIRIDKPTCITRVGLFDMVERIYQKEDAVRHEFKTTKSVSLQEFESLLQGGMVAYNTTQANFALVQQVGRLIEAFKAQNEQLLNQSKLLESVVNWIFKNGGSNHE